MSRRVTSPNTSERRAPLLSHRNCDGQPTDAATTRRIVGGLGSPRPIPDDVLLDPMSHANFWSPTPPLRLFQRHPLDAVAISTFAALNVFKTRGHQTSGIHEFDEFDVYTGIAHLAVIVPTLHAVVKLRSESWAGLILENAGTVLSEYQIPWDLTHQENCPNIPQS
ncbi:hypothetical protein C8R45DRAFT_1188621 [Mycena sanguinolenta]|nr:hypothetical protein C8R45DRAFT_1188621 [Mycena sanguinolenta]